MESQPPYRSRNLQCASYVFACSGMLLSLAFIAALLVAGATAWVIRGLYGLLLVLFATPLARARKGPLEIAVPRPKEIDYD